MRMCHRPLPRRKHKPSVSRLLQCARAANGAAPGVMLFLIVSVFFAPPALMTLLSLSVRHHSPFQA